MDVTATVVQHRLQQRQEDARERQERFNLLQTAIISAVVLGLTAVQALGYQLPLPGPLKPPVIAALGAIALLLATIVVRLALSSGRRLLAWPSYMAAGLTFAALAWLAVAWISGDGLNKLAAPATTRLVLESDSSLDWVSPTPLPHASEGKLTRLFSQSACPGRRSMPDWKICTRLRARGCWSPCAYLATDSSFRVSGHQ